MTPDLTAYVATELGAVGGSFGPAPAAWPAPRWGALYAALDAAAEPVFVVALELIYEGYLLHYRQSRAVALAPDDAETRLLAGDCYYARGLHDIAALGDVDAVGLLARLMAACSYLRSSAAAFAADDALWAYTMGGLAAQHAGLSATVTAAVFDELGVHLGAAGAADVPALAADAARGLSLRDPAPLYVALEAACASTGASSTGASSAELPRAGASDADAVVLGACPAADAPVAADPGG